MAKITYLSNTGFAVETPDVLLVFDDYRDPAHTVVKALEHNPVLPVIFLVSDHRHFNNEIFNIGQNHKRLYLLANDCPGIADSDMPTQYMAPGDHVENLLGGVSVRAFASNGPGLVYVVTVKNGAVIMHGGSLAPIPVGHVDKKHDKELAAIADEKKSQRVIENEHEHFATVLNRIKAAVPQIDLAFIAVDERLGKYATTGIVEAVETLEIANAVPMGFEGEHSGACRFDRYDLPSDVSTRFHCIHTPGEGVRLKLNAAEAHV